MPEISALQERNRAFAATFDAGDLPMRPRMWTVVLTCFDARVVPASFLGLELGDAFVTRNAGGRVTEAFVEDLSILSALGAHMPDGAQPPLELILIRHTNCGMARLAGPPVQQDVANRLGVSEEEVAALAMTDEAAAVRADIERLRSMERVPDGLVVSGHVYDVTTGLLQEVVPPVKL
jgi:carbonic anhydrase